MCQGRPRGPVRPVGAYRVRGPAPVGAVRAGNAPSRPVPAACGEEGGTERLRQWSRTAPVTEAGGNGQLTFLAFSMASARASICGTHLS